MSKKKHLALGLASLCLLAGAHTAMAQEESQTNEIKIEESDPEFEQAVLKHFEKRFFKRIEATSEQKDKIDKLLTGKLSENRSKRQACKKAVKELLAMVADPASSEDSIRAQAEKARSIHSELSQDRLNTFLAVRAMLTESQKKQLGDRLKNLGARFRRVAGHFADGAEIEGG